MSSVHSLRSLIRPTTVAPKIHLIVCPAAAFTTSTARSAKPPAAKTGPVQSTKQKTNYRKAPTAAPTKKPNPGERKAFRKRIQLSNNSALAVEGMEMLEAGTMAGESARGKMLTIPDQVVDRLRALEAFKPTQSWGLFRKPHVLLRKEVAELVAILEGAADAKKAAKVVLTGSRLSGKSLALLQAMSHALLNDWVVINIPEAQDLTNGNTEYSPIPDTKPIQFTQPVYTQKLLQNIYNANKDVLSKLQIQRDWTRLNVQHGDSLADLILSCKEADFAWPTFYALYTELTLPGRPPLLFTLDGLAHINKMSKYRDPSFNLVHSHDLTLIRTFVDALSGNHPFPNGAAIIAATSENNTHHHPSQELVLSQLEAGQAKQVIPTPDPYEKKYDERVYEALKNTQVLRIEGVSHDEARALMEYWGASGLMRRIIDSKAVREKWALAGHGIIGEMERAALMTMRM